MLRETKHLYEFDDFRFDKEKKRLRRGDDEILLPPKAFELLQILIERQGQTVEKDFLMNRLWQDTFVEEANLTQNIYLLRKALGKTADGKNFIETLPKRGYRFAPEVNFIEAEGGDALTISKITNIRARVIQYEVDDEAETNNAAAAQIRTAKSRFSPAPILVYSLSPLLALVIVSAVYFGFYGGKPTDAPIKSIAVMPLKTIGAVDGDENVFGLGLTDAIINRLGKTGKVSVNPTDAVRRYDERGVEALEAARALGAEAVLTGSVQRDRDRVRVTVQLVRTSDRQTLWTDGFDEKSADVFVLQDKISQRLAGALTLRLSAEERQKLSKPSTTNVEAYEFYLQGRFFLSKRTADSVRKAIECFTQAARLDENYAEAYAGLADAYALNVWEMPPAERFPKAKAAVLRALELNETLAEAHTSLAFILYKYEWNWLAAETHFRRAIQINPNYASGHHWFGEFLGLMGKFDEGLDELRAAERLDPLSQPIKSDIARILYRARRFDEAFDYAHRTLELDANYRGAYSTILLVNEASKNYPAAVEANLNYLRLSDFTPDELKTLKTAFDTGGWQNYWRTRLNIRQTKPQRNEYFQAYTLAEFYLRIGERDKAIENLEKSFDERGDAPYFVRAEPLLDELREDERFQNLVRRAVLDGETRKRNQNP